MSTPFACPHCKKLLNTATPFPAGTRIKCPQCATVFAVGGSAAPPAPVAAAPKPPVPAPRPQASPTPSLPENKAPAPKSLDAVRSSAKKGVAAALPAVRAGLQKAKARPLLAAGVAAGIAAAFLFLCTGSIGGLYFAFRGKPKPATPLASVAQAEETPAAPEPPKKKRKKYTSESPTRMAPEVLQKVKRSTVYIRVVDGRGEGGTGSGFFAYEPGIVLTNAHVVGMMEADSKPPRRIDVILNSGERDERNLTGEVVAVDSQTDVAVLLLSTKDNLPQPLEVISAEELVETQPVYICGFPFGERIGKNITVSPSQVSSLRKSPTGDLTQVQVNGGMNPGNSGGPVVDTDGDVVGVAVAGIRGSSINFAIPGDSVELVLNGQIKSFQLGTPTRRGSDVVVPVTVTTADPLKRIRRVAVEWWEGKNGGERPGSHQPPTPEAGDSEHRTVSLTYASGVARGELVLPTTTSGTFWIQPAYAGDGYHRWMTANAYLPDLVDAKPATLAYKQPTQPVKSRLSSRSRFRLRNDDGQEHSVIRRFSGRLTEDCRPGTPQGNIDCKIKISDLEMITSRDSRSEEPDDRLNTLRGSLNQINLTLVFDARGNLLRRTGEFGGVPVPSRREAERFCGEVLNTLDTVTVPMPPNPSVQPGNGWKTNKAVPIDTMRGVPMGQLDMSYTYRGTRMRNGKEEAVIAFKGPLVNTRGMTGSATGHGVFDLKKGQFVQVKADVEITMSVIVGGQIVKAIGTTEVFLDRDPE